MNRLNIYKPSLFYVLILQIQVAWTVSLCIYTTSLNNNIENTVCVGLQRSSFVNRSVL